MRITEDHIVNILCGRAKTPEETAARIMACIHDRPAIVTLCGSTRFRRDFEEVQRRLTLSGDIVLSVGFFPHAEDGDDKEATLGLEAAKRLDELHKRKIDLSDYIFVINRDGYIGESTRSEIEYAHANGIPVAYLEDQP